MKTSDLLVNFIREVNLKYVHVSLKTGYGKNEVTLIFGASNKYAEPGDVIVHKGGELQGVVSPEKAVEEFLTAMEGDKSHENSD